jgi:FtsZ-binding cell division protein ZapB
VHKDIKHEVRVVSEGIALAEASNLDILEKKINDTIAMLGMLKEDNSNLTQQKAMLESKIAELQGENGEMRNQISGLESSVETAEQTDSDLNSLKGRVDDILSKFEMLEL